MCNAAAKDLEVQDSREYWSKTEKGYKAAVLHRLRPEERINLPAEPLQAERYFTKYGIIVCKDSRLIFKAKRI